MRFSDWLQQMMHGNKKRFLLLLCVFFVPLSVWSMEMDTLKVGIHEMLITQDTTYYGSVDSVILLARNIPYTVRKDREAINAKLYDSISAKTKKVPIAHNLFNAMRIRKHIKIEEDSTTALNPATLYFTEFVGKTIRKVDFKVVDLFEGKVQDTTKVATSWGAKLLNSTHYNTRSWVLRNYLLFNAGDKIDPVKMSESERILRSVRFIEDSRIYVKEIDGNPDQVDIVVVTKDNFPVAANVEVFGTNHIIFDPYNTNFLGLGHRVSGRLIYDQAADQTIGYGAEYKIDNLFGNFVKSTFGFSKTDDIDMYRANITKPFITTDIRFGGEFDLAQVAKIKQFDRGEQDTVYRGEFPYLANTFDAWLGYSFYYFNHSTNHFLNVSAMHNSINYLERKYIVDDTTVIDVDSTFYPFHNRYCSLANLSLRKIDYLKTSKLFGYGRTEDVPQGYILDVTGGYQNTQYYFRPYMGVYYFWGKYYPRAGYFSYSLGSGTFLRNGKAEDFVTGANFIFFSPLANLYGMEFRNTFNATYNSVTNPLYYSSIDFGDDLRVLQQDSIYGASKITFQAQTIIYTYLNVVGFRFAFYPFIDFGWLAKRDFFGGEKRFFAVYGLGVQIKNESLLFPGLHIKGGYMPHTLNGRPNFAVTFLFRDVKLFKRVRSVQPQIIDEYFYK